MKRALHYSLRESVYGEVSLTFYVQKSLGRPRVDRGGKGCGSSKVVVAVGHDQCQGSSLRQKAVSCCLIWLTTRAVSGSASCQSRRALSIAGT